MPPEPGPGRSAAVCTTSSAPSSAPRTAPRSDDVGAAELGAGRGDARGGAGIDVDPDHIVALGHEPAAHRGADEARRTRDSDRAHLG